MNAPELVRPDTQALVAQSSTHLAEARAFKIVDQATLEQAGGFLTGLKALQKKIADTFDPHIARAHAAHKALVKEKNDAAQPLIDAEAVYKPKILAYQQAEEAKRREAERIAREKAEREAAALRAKAAEEEAKAKAKADELRRQEEAARAAEAAAKAAGDAKAAAAAAASAAKLASKAGAAEAAGAEKVAELSARAETVPTPVIASTVTKVAGISTRETWKAELTSKTDLIKAVAAGTVPAMALEVNMTFLNSQARAMKGELAYPGVKAVKETGIAAGRG